MAIQIHSPSIFQFNSLTGSDLDQCSSGNDRRDNIELQQIHLKLERDHRYGSELLRRSLTAAPEQSKHLYYAEPSWHEIIHW